MTNTLIFSIFLIMGIYVVIYSAVKFTKWHDEPKREENRFYAIFLLLSAIIVIFFAAVRFASGEPAKPNHKIDEHEVVKVIHQHYSNNNDENNVYFVLEKANGKIIFISFPSGKPHYHPSEGSYLKLKGGELVPFQ